MRDLDVKEQAAVSGGWWNPEPFPFPYPLPWPPECSPWMGRLCFPIDPVA